MYAMGISVCAVLQMNMRNVETQFESFGDVPQKFKKTLFVYILIQLYCQLYRILIKNHFVSQCFRNHAFVSHHAFSEIYASVFNETANGIKYMEWIKELEDQGKTVNLDN